MIKCHDNLVHNFFFPEKMQLFLFWQNHILTVIVTNVLFVLILEKSVREEYITSNNSHHSKYWKTLNMIDVTYEYENY